MALSSKTQRSRLEIRALSVAVAACFTATPAWSLPTDATIVNGTVTFDKVGNVLSVTNSHGAIIDWQKFGIAAGELTKFIQSSAASSVLNRVVGSDLSAIYGSLQSNGRVWLVNPAGILVGPGATIDTAAFVASTLAIRNEDFLAGKLTFSGPGGNLVNQGTITTPAGGSVYLIGTNVSNEGIITTPKGETILAAGQTVSLIDTATPGVKVEITGAAGDTTNLGTVAAEAGRIGMAGVIVRNSGTLNASSVVEAGGKVFLRASQDTYVDGNGRIVATGTQGGHIEVLGNRVAVMDNASLDASGENGGGTVLVGGDFQGKNPDVQNSQITYFGPNASIKANAQNVGAGGKVIVWADDTTRAYGAIEARGGNGGFVETSGKQYLDANGIRVDTGGGTWLLDPTDITIYATGTSLSYGGTPFFVLPGETAGTGNLGWDTLNGALSSNNVIVQTASSSVYGSGSIVVASPGTLAGGPYSLSLLAENGITINNSISLTGTGNLTMVAGWDPASGYSNPTATHATNPGNMAINAGANISGSGNITLKAKGGMTIIDATVTAGGAMNVEATSLTINAVSAVYGGAGLISQGNQTISLGNGAANGHLGLSSTVGQAQLRSYGGQAITFSGSAANTLMLQGSNSNTLNSGNAARIQAGGTQSITHSNGSLAITLNGGFGTATYGGDSYYDGVLVCTGCGTFNDASIGSGGNQTIRATTITINGGSGGNGNWAGIESKANADYVVSGAININGGYGGGVYVTNLSSVSNDAGLGADGVMTLSAGSITLYGGSAVSGGAYIGGEYGLFLSTSGNVSLTGGSTSSGYVDNPATPAFIGGKYGYQYLSIGGNLSVTSGVGSQAGIGSFSNATSTSIYVGGTATLTASSASAPVGLGSLLYNNWGYYPGMGDIGISSNVYLTASGNINIYAGSNLGIAGTVGSSGTINLYSGYATAVPRFLEIGGYVFGNTVNVTSTGAILQGYYYDPYYYDPYYGYYYSGSGLISANTITLTSTHNNSGGLAISANTASSGSITATVLSSATSGGISIHNSGNPTQVRLIDSSPYNGYYPSWISFGNFGDLALGSGSQFSTASGGDIDIWSWGLLTLSNLSLQSTQGGIWLDGWAGINLSGVTLRATAPGGVETYSYAYPDMSGTTTYSYRYNYNGVTLSSDGDITLAQGTKIETPNADVFFELYGTSSRLFVGKAGDTAPSYVLAKPTTTYIDFLSRPSADGVYIDGVLGLNTTVGKSGFYSGSLTTPATSGAGLAVSYPAVITTLDAAVSNTLVNTLTNSSSLNTTQLSFVIVPPPIPGGSTPASLTGQNAGGGEGEFGGPGNGSDKDEDKKNGQDGERKPGEGQGRGKRPVAQCKG